MTTGTSLNCLSCGTTLDQRREHGVTVDYCPDCGGVWLDPGELEQLTGHSSHHHKDRDIDIDIEAEEEDEFEEAEEEEAGILGTIAGALGGEEAEGEFEEEGFEEEGFEEEFGGEEEF
ncbi:zf-TFIIB domain-containing protein [Halomicroarcula sp. GCM10025709]|uniref:TFIIB-type zinc ribbon-containing protein n=1 Tax=Haloarcula TaxID=2237 RepID=UPI0024C29166|nr:zf-TFIIB domain-containing protein [Halomicroarcula sp. YJ-61-S]